MTSVIPVLLPPRHREPRYIYQVNCRLESFGHKLHPCEFIEDALVTELDPRTHLVPFTLASIEDRKLIDLFHRSVTDRFPRVLHVRSTQSEIERALSLHAERFPLWGKHPLPRRLMIAIHAIYRRISDPTLDVVTIAQEAGVSHDSINSDFRAHFGMSAWKFVMQLRMKQAERLIRDTELHLMDICLAVGHTDASNFARAFSRHSGITPARYRAQHRIVHSS